MMMNIFYVILEIILGLAKKNKYFLNVNVKNIKK